MAKLRWKRVLLWSLVGLVVAILGVVGGFYLWFHSQVSAANERVDPAIVEALEETATTRSTVASGSPGSTSSTLPDNPSGMNIVLVGYDKRPAGSAEVTEGRSDTIILVHVDPDADFLSLLSVPRDMLADVPGYGLYKLNAAYAFGGGALLIRTIQSEIGVDLDHYAALNLEGFKTITDALGGVFMDVDRPYLNETLPWEHIKLQPGYQLLNGADALDYVRFRHDDNIDFGRMARQQQFIGAVREQALGWNLTFKIPSLVKALFANLDTDLSANDIIRLAYWVMRLDPSRIKQAEFKAGTGTIHGIFYVLPTDEELAATVSDFYTAPLQSVAGARTASTGGAAVALTPATATTLSQVDLSGAKVDVVNATGRVGQGALATVWLSRMGATVLDVGGAQAIVGPSEVRYPAGRSETAGSVARALGIGRVTQSLEVDRVTAVLSASFSVSSTQFAGAASPVPYLSDWRRLTKAAAFPLTAPTYVPAGFSYSFQRGYEVVPGDKGKPAVRVGYKQDGKDLYLGISESTWLEAPLASPGVRVEEAGVVYTVVGGSTRIDHVWWVQNGVLHWVTNTLFGDLGLEDLLAVAMSTVAVPPAAL